ncbi:MAG: GAF domain-containing protein [Deltaproteobacteria bacterium]|nr:GAF domain-containing protein [Deltaproteobacteria bacterium]
MNQKSERRFYLRHFKAISHAIATYEDLNTLINHLAEGTCRTFEGKGCSIMLLEERENRLIHVASYGISEEYLQKGPVQWVDSKQSAFISGKPAFVEDMQNDPRIQYPKAAAREGFVSMLSIPIKSREAIIGVIRIYFDESRPLHEEDVDSLCVLTELLGLVIENNGLKNFLDHVKMALENLPVRLLDGV